MIKVIELGPFGCRIDRGTLKSLDDIPEGFKAEGIENRTDSAIVGVMIILDPLASVLIRLVYNVFRDFTINIQRRHRGLGPHPRYNFYDTMEERKRLRARARRKKVIS